MSVNPSLSGTEAFEYLIDGLFNNQVGTIADFLTPELVDGLHKNLLQRLHNGSMHPAGIGRKFDFVQNTSVRGDIISWIDDDTKDPFEQEFLKIISEFSSYLNATCYSGIKSWEFHYALYAPLSFYKRHKDQFLNNRGRQFSLIHYLNDDWNDMDGGQLVIYQNEKKEVILPTGGRVVFFKADQTEHEVLPSIKPRMSIAGWLKDI